MTKLPAIALVAVTAACFGGTALAARPNNHVLTVALPDGSTARIDYVGDVAPKVIIEPTRRVAFGDWSPLPVFAGFDRMIDEMNREAEGMMREAQQAAVQPGSGTAAQRVASFGEAPAGFESTTIVSYSNGNSTCTRSTETVSQGLGKPPKVSSTVSGNCARRSGQSPAPNLPRLNHT